MIEAIRKETRSAHALGYFAILRTASRIEVAVKEALRPLDITHAQLNVLSLLAHQHPRPMSAGTIGKGVIVASPDITRLIDRLVKKGLVDRKTCPDNRRQMDITITKDGISLFYKAHTAAKLATGDFFQDKITAAQATELAFILSQIRK